MRKTGVAIASLAAIVSAGCSSTDPAASPPRAFYGEVHVHGFAGGSHPGALFIAAAVPADQVDGDDILPGPPADATVDGCRLTTQSCADCPAPPPPIDGGAVRITGGLGIADVELRFVGGAYRPTLPLGGALFEGGETLTIDGAGATAAPFHGTLTAPMPLALTLPGSARLGGGDFLVAWVPDRSTRIDVTLVVSTSDGRFATIECTGDDRSGALAVPAALVARLPAAPRDVQLMVSRDVIVTVPSDRSGLGVVTHAGFETAQSWHEDP